MSSSSDLMASCSRPFIETSILALTEEIEPSMSILTSSSESRATVFSASLIGAFCTESVTTSIILPRTSLIDSTWFSIYSETRSLYFWVLVSASIFMSSTTNRLIPSKLASVSVMKLFWVSSNHSSEYFSVVSALNEFMRSGSASTIKLTFPAISSEMILLVWSIILFTFGISIFDLKSSRIDRATSLDSETCSSKTSSIPNSILSPMVVANLSWKSADISSTTFLNLSSVKNKISEREDRKSKLSSYKNNILGILTRPIILSLLSSKDFSKNKLNRSSVFSMSNSSSSAMSNKKL